MKERRKRTHVKQTTAPTAAILQYGRYFGEWCGWLCRQLLTGSAPSASMCHACQWRETIGTKLFSIISVMLRMMGPCGTTPRFGIYLPCRKRRPTWLFLDIMPPAQPQSNHPLQTVSCTCRDNRFNARSRRNT